MIKALSSPFLPLFFTLFLTACSGYKEFYKQAQGATPEAVAAIRVAPPPATPIVERAQRGDSKMILDAYAKRGYIMIGSSMFKTGHPESEDSAVRQAQDVGADLVLILNPRYAGTVTYDIPITILTRAPNTPARLSSQALDDITSYAPATIALSDYGAVYFVKQRFRLGALSRDLNDAERQELQTNQGAVVRLVVDESPAFNADLQIGDVVIAVDGVGIVNAQAFNELLREHGGKQVALSIVRRGQRLEKTVQLNP